MKYVAMMRDELGDEVRCPLFDKEVFEFPKYDLEDNAMLEAFYTWKQVKEDELNKKWQSQYGSECTIFLERDYNDMSMSDWKAIGYGNDY